jgi:hypothetical protein
MAERKLANYEAVLGAEDDPRLPAGRIDLALLVDVYHEFSQPQKMLRKIRASLTPDGRMVLLEYRKEDPQVPILPAHKMSVAEVKAEIEPEGFRLEKTLETLPRQHILIFRKNRAGRPETLRETRTTPPQTTSYPKNRAPGDGSSAPKRGPPHPRNRCAVCAAARSPGAPFPDRPPRLRHQESGSKKPGALNLFPPRRRQRQCDLGDRRPRVASESRSRPRLHHARAGHQRLHFIHGEHDRRKIETRPQPVSHAGLSLHRDAGNAQIAYVPVHRPFGNLQPAGKLRGGGQAPPPQMLDDLEQPIGAPHLKLS